MNNFRYIAPDATHIWTPGYQNPFFSPGLFRRCCYKQVDGIWYSLNFLREWTETANMSSWFKTETEDGYFVTIEDFSSPNFQCVPEKE